MKTRIALLREMGAPRPYTDSRPIQIVEAELAPPGPGELLVRIAAAGICHSDLSVVNADRPRGMPLALGHEAAGVVVETGPGPARFQPGDHVVLVFAPSCGHCAPCAEGRPALCEPAAGAAVEGRLLTGSKAISHQGTVVNHHVGVSAFSDHVVVAEGSCVKIDPEIPLDRAALLGCAVLTGVGAVLNTGGLRMGQSCAIVGLGGVGLAGLLGAHAAGARVLIGVDPSAEKRAAALDLGAHHVFDPTDPESVAEIRALTGGGVDLAVELAGAVPALVTAYGLTRRGGTCVTAGLPNPTEKLVIPAVSLTANEVTLRGSYMGSCVPIRDIPRFAQMMMQGQLPIEKLVTHRLPLEEINAGFERLAAGLAIRQVIVFDS
ncbi:zinc-binding dehydrogenase [Phaeovulum vinaykumarii]|nr:zinc-binding dehydrogenase [Phaeovulum vinaykumarii]